MRTVLHLIGIFLSGLRAHVRAPGSDPETDEAVSYFRGLKEED